MSEERKTNMRVVSMLIVLALLYLGAVDVQGEDGAALFSLIGPTRKTYEDFIDDVRAELIASTTRQRRVHKIHVLPASVRDEQRFVLVDLINTDRTNVTVAIDVLNVRVVAYRTDDKSYFLREAPDAAFCTLFIGTHQYTVNYDSEYDSLESAAGEKREQISLGRDALRHAIEQLRGHGAVAKSLIVINEMVSGAARFKAMEFAVRASMHGDDFLPHDGLLSYENQWEELSLAVQSTRDDGIFGSTVEVLSKSGYPIHVNNVRSQVITSIALLLYQCKQPRVASPTSATTRNLLRVPVAAPATGIRNGRIKEMVNNEEKICDVKNGKTRISGFRGKCLEVKDSSSEVQLKDCSWVDDQQWTFHSDGSIRSMGKCMILGDGGSVEVADCDSVPYKEVTQWTFSTDGTITNYSGMALTAYPSWDPILTVEPNIYATYQCWTPVDKYEVSHVASIVGYNDRCWEAQEGKFIYADCVVNKGAQEWRLYHDGTIRVNMNLSLCVTQSDPCPDDKIYIDDCRDREDSARQRWLFRTDGTIFNPASKMLIFSWTDNMRLVPAAYDPEAKRPQNLMKMTISRRNHVAYIIK